MADADHQENAVDRFDYENAIPLAEGIYWVGFYDEKSSLHCNPYLLIDGDEAALIDSGTIPHFPIVMRKVIDLVELGQVSYLIAQHQDPDVCGNIAVVEDLLENPALKIVAHGHTVRLIRHYGTHSEYYPVEENDYRLTLKSGRVLRFIFTPYLHSPGAIATFDEATGTLFSSDLFGGLSRNWSLKARPGYIEAMEAFHRIYMPSNKVLRPTIERLEKLPITRILPQHGSVIEGDDVKVAMAHLKELACGVDLNKELVGGERW
ncbi:MAG: MBL fold metallo-hydrolase [Nitrospinae bacterium]|nr:MBL fold metallo-hydrolase [Nitrospinota bacterium]